MLRHWEEPYYKNFENMGYKWPKHMPKIRDFFHHYRQHNIPELIPGIREDLLDKLRKIKGLKMGIVTSSPPITTDLTLDALGLTDLFDLVVSEDNSLAPKPDPAYLLKAMEILGVTPEQTIYIGDLPSDLQAAKAAGCQKIGVRWGFGKNRELMKLEDRLAISPRVVFDMISREIAKKFE